MQRLPCDSLGPSHQLWGNSFQKTEWIPSTCDGSKADCCALPVILGQESVPSPRWDGSAEGHQQPSLCVALWCLPCFNWRGTVGKIHLWAHGSPPQLGPGLFARVTACRKAVAPGHWKQKSFVYRPSNSSIIFPQADLPAHLCLLPPLGHSGVQAPQPIQFSISWRRRPTKVPRGASCITTDKLNKVSMDCDYVTAEENCGARARKLATKVGKEDSLSPNTMGAQG